MDNSNIQKCERCGKPSYVTMNHLCYDCTKEKENANMLDKLANYIIYQDLKECASRDQLSPKGLAVIMEIQSDKTGHFITKPDKALDLVNKLRSNLGIKEVKENESDS